MIIVKFFGGLGNQMFQYATYLALQHRYKDVTVTADISWYNMTAIHNGLELENLFDINLNVQIGNKNNRSTLLYKYYYGSLSWAVKQIFKRLSINKFEYIQDTNSFNENLFCLNQKKNYYLDGNWGNEKYFLDIKDLLLTHLKFRIPLDKSDQKLFMELSSLESTSIHIRRGDYVTYNHIFVDLCKTNYYQLALNFLQSNKPNSRFYVFSDDTAWCKDNLKWTEHFDCKFIYENSGSSSYKDLQFMASCKNNIIANSTFSWWAAWLNTNSEKLVVCPTSILHDNKKNNLILKDFYPSEWIVK